MDLRLLLPFVLVSFAANSLVTRHVVGAELLDAGLLAGVRFVAGAVALLLLAAARRERVEVGRGSLLPALWLGLYAVCNAYGFARIGAAAGTFVFYTAVLLVLVVDDRRRGAAVPVRRQAGAAVALVGIGVLATDSVETVSVVGVVLLAGSGAAWGLYTAAGRGGADPRRATTANFAVLGLVCLVPTGAGFAAGAPATASGVLWSVVLGAGTTAFGYVAWYACQRRLTGAQAGLVQLSIPVLTTAGAVSLLGEPLTARLVAAALLVGLGMWLGRAVPARPPSVGSRTSAPAH